MAGIRAVGEQQFKQAIARPKPLGPEYNPWFWHPSRGVVKTGPQWFQDKLDEVAPNLAVTWNPIKERWQVWERAGRINHPICSGWKLLFIHHDSDGNYLPLDERVLARLWSCSLMANGSAKSYMGRVIDEFERDREKAEKQANQDHLDEAMPFYDHSQISVSMRGHSNGSKFSTYLA